MTLWSSFTIVYTEALVANAISKLFCSVLISALVQDEHFMYQNFHIPHHSVPGFAYLRVVVHVCGIVVYDVWGLYSDVVSPVGAAHYALPTLRLVKLCVE